jgi:hypothetical protein
MGNESFFSRYRFTILLFLIIAASTADPKPLPAHLTRLKSNPSRGEPRRCPRSGQASAC